MKRSKARAALPPAAYRKVVPCPLCAGRGGFCRACRGEARVTVHLPLRCLTDEELRVHASQLFDAAVGVYGSAAIWVLTAKAGIPLSELRCGADLHRAVCLARPAEVRDCALRCAKQAGKIGHRDALRALCEVARRARQGSYGATESCLSVPAQVIDFAEFTTESQAVARLPRGSSRAGASR